MKTEEILRYEAEFKAMREALGITLLVFQFSNQAHSQEEVRKHTACCRVFHSKYKRYPVNQTVSKGDEAKPDR